MFSSVIIQRESFAGGNLNELLKVGFSLIKLSQIVGENNDTPSNNNAAVLSEIFHG